MKEAAYYGRPRREMHGFVPAGASTVLDVGCGAGAFGAGLKEARPELVVWGVELQEKAARRAEKVLDRVFVGDAGAVLDGLGDTRFDCIILNDVLEHVMEPRDLLKGLAPRLAAGGRLVASIPNVRFFPNVVDLALRGRWEYTDEGILDRTHVRFFTRSSMVRLLESAGYDVISTTGINGTGAAAFRLFNALTLGRFADMRWLQFACVAARADEEGAP